MKILTWGFGLIIAFIVAGAAGLLKRFLTEAKVTDLVLLLQGTAAVQFIDQGE